MNLFLAECFIHKSTFIKKTPYFVVFQKEMELYLKLITNSTNEKAIETFDFCDIYKVFM